MESKGLNSLISFIRFDMEKKMWNRIDNYLIEVLIGLYSSAEEAQKELYHKNYESFVEEIGTCSKESFKTLQLLLAEGLWAKISKD